MNGCWCALNLVIFLLCRVNKGQEVVTLGPCGDDGVFEVVNNTASQNLTLRVNGTLSTSYSRETFEWSLQLADGRSISLATCANDPFLSNSCGTRSSGVFNVETKRFDRLSVHVVLAVSATSKSYNLSGIYFDNGTALFGKSRFAVDRRYKGSLHCSTDFVELAESVECYMAFNASSTSRSITSRCDVTKVFSARGRYNCQLFVMSAGRLIALGSSTPMTISAAENGYHVNGSCTMTAAELETADGKDSYIVEITPGKKRFDVKMRKPSRPSHHCPTSVREGGTVTCSCDLSDVGHPPATAHWQQTGSASMAMTNISRHDNGRVFTCLVVWNGSQVDSATYRLSVQYGPASPSLSHNCPAYVTQGSTLDCSCFTSEAGSPPATLAWSSMTSQSHRLLRQNVQDDADGTVLTCLMTWGGMAVTSINYTINVVHVPDSIATYASGVGLGLGVGVMLMAVAVVAVLAMVLWRKGWVLELPCADRKKTGRCDVFPSVQSGCGRALPEVKPSAGDQLPLQATARHYETLDVSKTGLSNNYEALGKSSGQTSNVKPNKRLKKKGTESQIKGETPTQSNLEETASEVYENVSV